MALTRFQRQFFKAVQDISQILEAFDYLHDVFVFVKDLESRMVTANSAVIERLGLKSAEQISGMRDEQFFPKAVARSFRNDDLRVYKSGKPMVHRLEAWYDELHELTWFLTTKVPLRNKQGEVIGLIGIMRRDAKTHAKSTSVVTNIVQYTRLHASDDLSNATIAKAFSLSERTLHRKLQQSLGITPHELVIRSRVQRAAEELVSTDRPISKIAVEYRFCDQSAFTQQFKKRIGMTPLQFRNHHKSSSPHTDP